MMLSRRLLPVEFLILGLAVSAGGTARAQSTTSRADPMSSFSRQQAPGRGAPAGKGFSAPDLGSNAIARNASGMVALFRYWQRKQTRRKAKEAQYKGPHGPLLRALDQCSQKPALVPTRLLPALQELYRSKSPPYLADRVAGDGRLLPDDQEGILILLGNHEYFERHLEGAETCYSRLLDVNTDNSAALEGLAIVQSELGTGATKAPAPRPAPRPATPDADRPAARDRDGNIPARAQALYDQGRTREGVALLESAVKREPRTARYWDLLGDGYRELGHLDAAERAYGRASALMESER